MSKTKFTDGDKVYFPAYSTEIFTVRKSAYADDGYPIKIEHKDKATPSLFFIDGRWRASQAAPSIIEATQENYELLSKLHPSVEFEKPPIRKSSEEIIQLMLDDWRYVICCVSDNIKSPDDKGYIELVYGLDIDNEYPFIGQRNDWKYATPFDLKTGKVIVDYVNGQVVLENDDE